jgi:ATP-dependent DNA ligase
MTGHAAINHLQFILGSLSKEDAKIIERIIAKDMRCGVSEATVNKIWPGTVPSYPVMLASGYDQKLVDKIQFPAYVQLKLDGMRFNAIVKGEVVEYRSRNGKELTIPNKTFDMPFITMAKFYGEDMVFDGELLVVDATGTPVNRQTGNGILSKSIKGTMGVQEAVNVRATLWDAITFEKFSQGIDKEPYSARMSKLSNAISYMRGQKGQIGHYIDLVWNKQVNDIATAQKIFEKFLSEGQEGTILKSKDGIWEDKRSKTQIKFKGELECELKVCDRCYRLGVSVQSLQQKIHVGLTRLKLAHPHALAWLWCLPLAQGREDRPQQRLLHLNAHHLVLPGLSRFCLSC